MIIATQLSGFLVHTIPNKMNRLEKISIIASIAVMSLYTGYVIGQIIAPIDTAKEEVYYID